VLAQAGVEFDLISVQAVVDRWWGVAAIRANPLSEHDRVHELLEVPRLSRSTYDDRTDRWTTTYGDGGGLIVYAVVGVHERVVILRLV
jgi:hypothetical protein